MNHNPHRNGTASPFVFTVNGTDRRLGLPPAPDMPYPAAKADAAPRGPAMAVIASEASEREVQVLVEGLRVRGIEASVYDVGPGVILLPSVTADELDGLIRSHPVVARVGTPETPYRLARREVVPDGGTVTIGRAVFGGSGFGVIAGPCAVESRAQIVAAARAAAAAGAVVLRGGAFKPRSSPYAFQGLGMLGIELLAEARAATGLPFVTEVIDPAHVERLYPLVDAFQVGARNMQNYELLKALGDVDRPVLLKRGPSATLDEWLLAAEYVLAAGNDQIILCERGIRTFNQRTRFTLDLATMALAKRETHLPVIVDPSHATGDAGLVVPMARAALAGGADGIIVEMHPHPAEALSDGFQALRPADLADLVDQLRALAPAVGRQMGHAGAANLPA